MKRLLTILVIIFIYVGLSAQSPEKTSYQAVVRDATNKLIANHAVGIRISILKTSIAGTVVYTETQSPTTNTNGLINIAIGTGVVLSGTFSAIDWSSDSYFIKTEIDPAGGTNYTITGINQLLSVPYALHSKTAERVTGSGSSAHNIGELYGGGVVCWVDHTGQHGLIVSMAELSTTGQIWSNVNVALETTNEWEGAINTNAITGQNSHISSAAKLCTDYTNVDYGTGTFSDWYLPSIAELNYVLNNVYEIQKAITLDGNTATIPLDRFDRPIYWSSSAIPEKIVIDQDDSGNNVWSTAAWVINFRFNRGDERITVSETGLPLRVRAMRAF